MSNISPDELTQVNFSAASAYVRDYKTYHKPVFNSFNHRCQLVKLDSGYIIIEKQWFRK